MHLCCLTAIFALFGRDQTCEQVGLSFSPFGHPTQVYMQVQLAATCEFIWPGLNVATRIHLCIGRRVWRSERGGSSVVSYQWVILLQSRNCAHLKLHCAYTFMQRSPHGRLTLKYRSHCRSDQRRTTHEFLYHTSDNMLTKN